jgi:alkylation response protein AidB-like acyl-CoA dehydrogenase
MDVRFSPEQELLRTSAHEFVERECPLARTREWFEAGRPFPAALWKQMAELGWLGLPFVEADGGAALGALELGLVQEALGRQLVPAPYYASVVLAGAAVALSDDAGARARVLPALAAGELRASLAFLEDAARWDADGVTLEAREVGSGFRLSGCTRFVPDGQHADLFVVAGRSADDALSLFLVEADRPGVRIRAIAWHDLTRPVAELHLDGVELPREARLGAPGSGWPVLTQVLARARAALAAEMSGGARRVLELSVAFAGAREQFGRPIGAFQAIQHKCADQLLAVEGVRSASTYAAWALDAGEPDAAVAASMAKAYASEAYARVAEAGIQIHGGLGFTWEQEPQLYYKRAKASALDLGDASWNRAEIARQLWG